VSKFRAVIKGERGTASKYGSIASGIFAWLYSWRNGLRVIGSYQKGEDVFEVFGTAGEIGGRKDVHIGTWREGIFYPSQKKK
jgi:hypothetical protein